MRRPFSYANVAATLALVFAMSGGALAARHYLITSTKQISPKVLKALSGKTGPTGGAGKEGRAGPAGKEGPAGPAGKEGAAGKEGVSGVTRWRATVAKAGKTEAEPEKVELAKVGPFTVTGHCYENGSKTAAATYIRTSEEKSFAQGYNGEGKEHGMKAEEEVQISEDIAEGETATHEATFDSADDGSWGAETATGSLSLNGFGSQGVWLQGAGGPACSFSGYLLTE
jgi:hypothetical protein